VLYLEVVRRDRAWTQRRLGDLTRIHQTHISAFERGEVAPTADQLRRLATALDVPPDLLLQPVQPSQVAEAAR
jgi:transcriptional regulator with XRE-family HTH domain